MSLDDNWKKPEYAPPSRGANLIASIGRFLLVVCVILIKLVIIMIAFFVALVLALAWPRKSR